jgi:hypothetical protein
MTNQKLDALITRAMQRDAVESEDASKAAARLLATLAAKPLPAQRKLMRWWPLPLLDIDLAPAWPRVVAFACVAAIGMAIGLVGPDLGVFESAAMASATIDADLGVFEAELLTGARP